MTYTLLIVESPAKCKKIENYLGDGYKCMASFGHLRTLPNLKAIDIENNFTPTFSIMESKRQQINLLKRAILKASDVILAADDDREGEAIAWHICQLFDLPVLTTKRIIFHEVTKSALQKAVSQPITLNLDVVYAQQARQVLDLVVGFKISPILWQKISQKTNTGLSAGRCQTPALRIVYENQKLIDESPGRKVYQITGYFTSRNLPFVLNFNFDNERLVETFLENTVNHSHIYNCGKTRSTTKQPPKPFTTSSLQQIASNELKYSPKDTMRLCQTLYEGGYITYMRTDSTTYSKDFIQTIGLYIKDTYGKEYLIDDMDKLSERSSEKKEKKQKMQNKGKKQNKDKKGTEDSNAQEAHEAIRPTKITCLKIDDCLGNREQRLYKLIWRNTVESCMPIANYNAITATITSLETYLYKYSAEQVVFPGWKIVAGYEKINNDYSYLNMLKNGSEVEYKKVIAKVSMKDLKTHYTEAKLVQLLEQKGIGRPSTFSSLIDKIQERNYVKKTNISGQKIKCIEFELENDELTEEETIREFGNEKNKLVIQPVGILVIEFLIRHFDSLFQYEYTKQMEDTLDVIAKGNKTWYTLCHECYQEIISLSCEINVEDKEKIIIDDNHTYMIGQYGPIIKCTIGDKTIFKKVRSDIDMDMLRDNRYTLDEIVQSAQDNNVLGNHEDNDIIVKSGKYGVYIQYDSKNISLSYLNKTVDEITMDDAIEAITKNKTSQSSIIRKIDDYTSIRKGKFGDYVFYKKPQFKKPLFIKIYPFVKTNGKDSYKTCDLDIIKKWLKTQTKI